MAGLVMELTLFSEKLKTKVGFNTISTCTRSNIHVHIPPTQTLSVVVVVV